MKAAPTAVLMAHVSADLMESTKVDLRAASKALKTAACSVQSMAD